MFRTEEFVPGNFAISDRLSQLTGRLTALFMDQSSRWLATIRWQTYLGWPGLERFREAPVPVLALPVWRFHQILGNAFDSMQREHGDHAGSRCRIEKELFGSLIKRLSFTIWRANVDGFRQTTTASASV